MLDAPPQPARREARRRRADDRTCSPTGCTSSRTCSRAARRCATGASSASACGSGARSRSSARRRRCRSTSSPAPPALDKSQMSRVVAGLTKRGIVARGADPTRRPRRPADAQHRPGEKLYSGTDPRGGRARCRVPRLPPPRRAECSTARCRSSPTRRALHPAGEGRTAEAEALADAFKTRVTELLGIRTRSSRRR